MASLIDFPTKCRFAVLEVSDDDEEEKREDGGERSRKTGSAKKADASNTGKAKKKKKKKRSRGKNNQSSEGVSHNNQEHLDENQPVAEVEEWNKWIQKDEQYVLNQFQRDLKEALEASKREATHPNQMQTTGESLKDKKKKEKPVVMSLDEFARLGCESDRSQLGTDSGSTKAEKQILKPSELDEFIDWPEESSVVKGSHDHFDGWNDAPSTKTHTVPQWEVSKEEKPAQTSAKSNKSSRKKNHSKSKEEVRNTTTASEKKLLTATREDQIQAEMVHIKDELDKAGNELIELRRIKIEHSQVIEDLKTELLQVKKRNKQLCFILSQAEMKEKSELLMQIDELNEVKEQVVQLHAELEQERSKNSALKSELSKVSGRTKHGSTS